MKLKELFSRAFFYTRLGYGSYLNWWIGAIAYITIIYELVLKQVLPPGIITYVLIFAGLMSISFLTGLLAARKGIYGVEHKINTETNPYIHIPIGSKEILGYQNGIAGLEREIRNYHVQIEMCKVLKLDDQIPALEQNIKLAEEYKIRLEEMLQKARK